MRHGKVLFFFIFYFFFFFFLIFFFANGDRYEGDWVITALLVMEFIMEPVEFCTEAAGLMEEFLFLNYFTHKKKDSWLWVIISPNPKNLGTF